MAEHRTPDGPDDPDTPEGEDGVEAYESDWYRSLQAVANREGNEVPSGDGESDDDDDDTVSDADKEDSKTGDEQHDGSKKKKTHPEPGEPGIWVVVTPDR